MGDGSIRLADPLALAGNYNTTGGVTGSFEGDRELARATVPEPTAAAALLAAASATLRGRRRVVA